MSKDQEGYIPLRDVAKRVGREWNHSTRMWLVRKMMAYERRQDGMFKILFRDSDGRGSKYYTTWAAIKHAFPQWFSNRDKTVELVEEELSSVDSRLFLLTRKCNALGRAVAELRRDVRSLMITHGHTIGP